jgi:hypothetical protein
VLQVRLCVLQLRQHRVAELLGPQHALDLSLQQGDLLALRLQNLFVLLAEEAQLSVLPRTLCELAYQFLDLVVAGPQQLGDSVDALLVVSDCEVLDGVLLDQQELELLAYQFAELAVPGDLVVQLVQLLVRLLGAGALL